MANALPVVLKADLDAATQAQLQAFVNQSWAQMVAYAQQLVLIDKLSTAGQDQTIATARAADIGQYLP